MLNSRQSRKNTNKQFKPVYTATTAILEGSAKPLGNIAEFQAKRNKQFKQQQIAKSFLKGVKKSHRFHNCLSASRDKGYFNISIYSNADQFCTYKGLQTCGSRSACTCCSPRLAEISRKDVLNASNQHLSNNGGFALVTFTIPHKLSDKLQWLIDKGTDARNKFNEMGAVKKIYKEMGRIGYVRAFENKHGANGWHPHQHFLFYLEKPIDEFYRISLQQRLLFYWQKACVKVGLSKPNEHGVDVLSCTDPLKASAYVVKDAFEVTYSNTKGSKTGSINPFDLLSDEAYEFGSRKELFKEYYKATKGVAMVYWSRGLKARFGINTIDDDEQAIDTYNEAEYTIPVVSLDILDWGLVKKYELRCDLLEFTEDYIQSKDLISIKNYDEYINTFFKVYKINIDEKRMLEPEPQYIYNPVDEVLDPYLSYLCFKHKERQKILKY